jgi:hypothetical protein
MDPVRLHGQHENFTTHTHTHTKQVVLYCIWVIGRFKSTDKSHVVACLDRSECHLIMKHILLNTDLSILVHMGMSLRAPC